MRYFYLLVFLGAANLFAQNLENEVISACGGQSTSRSMVLDWTIGESVIDCINNDQMLVSQGFHHSDESESIELFTISGNVLEGTKLLEHGKVELFLANASGNFPPVATLAITEGEFNLSFIPKSEYVIYAIPTDTNFYYPTYYVNAIQSENAYKLNVETYTGSIDIHLVPKLTGMQDLRIENELDVIVYPNPTSDFLRIKTVDLLVDEMSIDLVDFTGKVIMHKSFNNISQPEIDLSGYSRGLYMLKLIMGASTRSLLIVKN